jgi:hypothetical protein
VYLGVWVGVLVVGLVNSLTVQSALPASFFTFLGVTLASTLVGTYALILEVSPVSSRMEAQAPAGLHLGLKWWNSTAFYLPQLYAVLLMPVEFLTKLKTGGVNWQLVR